jgi:sugar transferase (PEP-CTERM/EpsH1 system associated)
MLTHRIPYPPDRGDRIRSHQFLKHLSEHFDVWLGCTTDEPITQAQHEQLKRLTVDYEIQPINDRNGKLRGIGSLCLGGAATPAYFYRRRLARTMVDWHRSFKFDTLFTFCTGMIQYARDVVRVDQQISGDLRHVIDLVDVDSEKWREYSELASGLQAWVYGVEATRLRRIEAGDKDKYDAVTVVSEAEAETYRQKVGAHPGLTAIRQAVDLDYYQPHPDTGKRIAVFIGVLNYKPNIDGICWFVNEVLPRIPKDIPFRLRIVGLYPTDRIRALAGPRVEVVGPVPDVRDYLRDASIVIAPLRIARGVQTKVLEGMASGRTVLCTPAAAIGIVAEPGHHIVVEESAEAWADSLQRLMADSSLRQQIAVAARQHVECHYGWEQCLRPLVPLIRGEE